MHRIVLGIILALLFLAGAFFGLYGVSFAMEGVTPGVYVGPVDLGGLTREEALRELNELSRRIENTPVHINYGDNSWQAPARTLGVSMDVENTLEEACLVGKTGSIINRITERQRVKHHGLHLEPALALDHRQLEKVVAEVWKNVVVEPENAGFKVLPEDSVVIVPGRMGTRIDFAALERKLTDKLNALDNNQVRVELPVLAVAPRRTTRDIESMEINGLIAQYSTRFDAGQAGRTYNIRVAAAALDGLLIAPGDEFSFNRVVGPRSSEAGYKNANVIINNELVEGLGGGVCQVSSTLYNAVLLANLQVVERSNHSLPVSYVPIGRDATVVYDALDLRFINNKDFYLYIRSIVTGSTLTVKLYGNRDKTPKVEVSSWVTEKIEPSVTYEKDPNLAAGEKVVKQEGKNGFKASAVRYVWQNGEKVAERLPGSHYKPVRRIIAVGTGESSPVVVVPLDEDLKPPPVTPGTIPENPATPDENDSVGTEQPADEDEEPDTEGEGVIPPSDGHNGDSGSGTGTHPEQPTDSAA